MSDPHITDDDHGVITATVCGKEVRAWSYANDDERRLKMRMAHEYAEGWFQARAAVATQDTLHARHWQRHLLDHASGISSVLVKANAEIERLRTAVQEISQIISNPEHY